MARRLLLLTATMLLVLAGFIAWPVSDALVRDGRVLPAFEDNWPR